MDKPSVTPDQQARIDQDLVDSFDEELELEPYKEIGIHTLPPIDTIDGKFDEVMTEISTE